MPRGSRVLGTGAAYLIVLAAIGLFVYSAIPPLISDSRDLLDRVPEYVADIRSQDNAVGEFVRNYDIDQEARELVTSITERLGQTDGPILDGLSRITTSLVTVLTVLVLTFLMLVEGPDWLNLFWSIYPNSKEKAHRELAGKMYQVVTGYVNGQLLVALIAGITSMLFMIIVARIDPQTAVPLAGIVGLAGLIPLIGTTLASAVVIIVALLNSLGAALAMLIFFITYQQIENNVIQPFVQSRTIDMSPLLVLVAVIVGFSTLGLIGAILSIPAAGVVRVLIIHYFTHHQADRLEASRSKRRKSSPTARSKA
jgi:predicted PurR-regulated permease PerM